MKKAWLLVLATILATACGEAPESAADPSDETSAEERGSGASSQAEQEISPLLQRYIDMQQALAADQFEAAQEAAAELAETAQGEIAKLARQASESVDMAAARQTFIALSSEIIEEAGVPASFKVAICPMADDNKGARWLQKDGPIRNPYYGAEMLECGYFDEESE